MRRSNIDIKEMIKFGFVGGMNTLIGTAVMFFAYNALGLGYWVSSALNYIVGSIFSYFANKYFTFKSKKKSLREVFRFVVKLLTKLRSRNSVRTQRGTNRRRRSCFSRRDLQLNHCCDFFSRHNLSPYGTSVR